MSCATGRPAGFSSWVFRPGDRVSLYSLNRWERVVAYHAVLRAGATATETEIIEHCRPHLAAYKRPRSIRFVPDLPKTSTGKVMRRELKTLDG
jgi:acyl-coenzyme A synthetase/AMP-(fatty) acid ligase